MRKNKLFSLFFSLLFGLLAALPLLRSDVPLLSFLVFLPFFYRLFAEKGRRLKSYYLHGLFFFLGYLMAAFSFFIAMYPLDFAGLDTLASLAVIFAATVLLPLFQSIFLALGVLLFGALREKGYLDRPLLSSLSLSAFLTVLFFCQNFTWAGVPWASPAVGLTSLPILIGSASLLGSGFLIFLILFVNSLLAEALLALRHDRRRASLLSLALAALLFLSNLLCGLAVAKRPSSEGETITVALLQSDASIKDAVTMDGEISLCALLARDVAWENDIDLMLWPESVIHHALENDEGRQEIFAKVAKDTGAIQIIGSFSEQTDAKGEVRFYNSLFVFHPDGTMDEVRYNKRRPVPFGEYLPMEKLFRVVLPALTEISMLERNTQPGEGASLFSFPFGEVGGLICFDSIYPALARESVSEGAALLLLSTNDSWFDGSSAKDIHFSHAVLRAVENGRPVLRAGTTGLTGVILPNGEVKDILPPDETEALVADVTLCADTTLYTETGDVFVLLLLAYTLLFPILSCAVRRYKRKESRYD
ncbi:MAG: apolipoprotein N-acyltransferase [Clostridia bacterium]|nr:apolipoprotein N-acyltransferase [Clostridia bacterium]